jgi:hypothetical protein
MTRKGNPNWGKFSAPGPAMPTEFELQVRRLRLSPECYALSDELRTWCQANRNRCYVPEWLLEAWDMPVDLGFGDSAA